MRLVQTYFGMSFWRRSPWCILTLHVEQNLDHHVRHFPGLLPTRLGRSARFPTVFNEKILDPNPSRILKTTPDQERVLKSLAAVNVTTINSHEGEQHKSRARKDVEDDETSVGAPTLQPLPPCSQRGDYVQSSSQVTKQKIKAIRAPILSMIPASEMPNPLIPLANSSFCLTCRYRKRRCKGQPTTRSGDPGCNKYRRNPCGKS